MLASYSFSRFNDKDKLEKHLKLCFLLLNKYKYMCDSYIIEYFVKDHWNNLPTTWQKSLNNIEPALLNKHLFQDIAISADTNHTVDIILPLSLMAFKVFSQYLSLPRIHYNKEDRKEEKLNPAFCKHVNPKKRHEIYFLSKYILHMTKETHCLKVIDFGSGQGHLARLLSLGYKIDVLAIENESQFLCKAGIFDKEATEALGTETIHKDISQTNPDNDTIVHKNMTPTHINKKIEPVCNIESLLADIKLPHTRNNNFILTGLHACGDLSSSMLRMFVESKQVHAVISVACCYMKLTTDNNDKETLHMKPLSSKCGYPMSEYVKSLPAHYLSNKSLRSSCHSIEGYPKRLTEDMKNLKMHCHRAVLEKLVRSKFPLAKRPPSQIIRKPYHSYLL